MVTVLASRRVTRFFQPLSFFNVYSERERGAWSLADNLAWVKEAWERGDIFLIIPCEGKIFKCEVAYLGLLNKSKNEN